MNKPTPTTNVSDHEALFHKTGLNGCIGSADTTYIPILKPPHSGNNTRNGFKFESMRKDVECTFGTLTRRFAILSVPSQNYNVTVDDSGTM